MFYLKTNHLLQSLLGVFLVLLALPLSAEEQSPVDMWPALKDTYFKGVNIIEDKSVIELVTPYRSEDAALTPVSIKAKIPQTPERYIKTIHMFVDKNPQPQVGVFHLTPEMGKADLAMRIRINEYTHVRAVAVLDNGEHHMTANFVKASGGCSAPPAADLKAAMERMGQMKFRTVGDAIVGNPVVGQFMVSHPNITGLQLDQQTRSYIPEHYVKSIAISYKDKPVMTADVGFSLSADPSLRFFFKPEKEGTIKAEVVDSKGMRWSETFEVKL